MRNRAWCALALCVAGLVAGCSGSDSWDCNIYYGTMVKLAPDSQGAFDASSETEATADCQNDPQIKADAMAQTGSPAVTCVCGMSPD